MTARLLSSIAQIEAAHWNALAGDGQPFLRHEFLLLHRQRRTGAMRPERVRHVLVRDITVRRMTMPGMHMAGLLMPIARAAILIEAMPAHCFP